MGDTLNVYNGGSGQFVKNFNPFSPTVLANVQGMIYESLFYFNDLAPLGTKPTPVLGESYEANDSGSVVTVKLKRGVKWSDGKPFTADDVAFTFNTVRDTKELDTTGNAPSAKVTGDDEVTLTFDKPALADIPSVLGSTWIVPKHIFSSMDKIPTDPNAKPVGTGPMKLANFTAQSYVFEKNDTFRQASDIRVPGMRMYSLSGNQAATNKLLKSELDWAGIFIPDVDKVLKPFPDISYSPAGYQQVELTACSNSNLGCTGPQTSPTVRQAISAAIDRNQINKLAYYGRGLPISPTYGVVKRDDKLVADQFSPASMQADVAKAKALLESDGWKLGADGIYAKGGKRLSMDVIVTTGYTDYIAALNIMKQQLQKAGIEIKPQQQANAEVISARGLGKFQLAIDGIFQGPIADLYYVYSKYFDSSQAAPVGKSGNPYGNVAKFSNPKVDAAVKAAGETEDIAEKAKLYGQVQSIIVPDMPYIPVINYQSYGLHSTANYTGWPTKDNPYAHGGPGGGGGEQTLLRLRPKK
ncbi:ABC transporter substrate-binding protein [Actinopolymorpha cephalotaxi]|nr:ABC transporter substrate-binding protein [Actinopolymorpha cephalotaxi]NYH86733.1 peptide/nickel transport system substrate-binding protein [Actinopolymorpha cephalotaxi]